jgi:hypothetical protein
MPRSTTERAERVVAVNITMTCDGRCVSTAEIALSPSVAIGIFSAGTREKKEISMIIFFAGIVLNGRTAMTRRVRSSIRVSFNP